MCSRFSRISLIKALQHRFLFEGTEMDFAPEYNLAPTDPAYVVVEEGGKRVIKRMMFGLIPHWDKNPRPSFNLNARAETVNKLPSFRDSFKSRRCLVLTDGFYEWKRDGKTKIPYWVILKSHEPYALAGIWDTWKRSDAREFETFAIITTKPNELISKVHDRMPCIIPQEEESLWLSHHVTESKTLLPLLRPYPPELLEMVPVSTVVNSSKNKSEECIRPV